MNKEKNIEKDYGVYRMGFIRHFHIYWKKKNLLGNFKNLLQLIETRFQIYVQSLIIKCDVNMKN